jgi:hypothetical protein
LLYRLSQSRHTDRLLLKGVMLFVLWDNRIPRPTRDVDLLGFGDMEVETVTAVFREIAATSVPLDGLEFLPESVRAEEIREGQEYGGIRIKLIARLGTGRISLQVDVGSGDAVSPDPKVADFPALLDFPAPRVRAYPVYTVVAEKFEAIVSLGLRNTRMKDFHDLWFLSRRFDFDGETLHRALLATFGRRKTSLDGELLPFTAGYISDADRQVQWQGFLTRNGLKGQPIKFPEVMTALRKFIGPILGPNTQHWSAS